MSDNRITESAYEIAVGSLQMQSKRLFIAWIITFLALVITNAGWIYYENQFEDVVVTQEAESDGDSSIILNGTGDMEYYGGESETDS